MLLLDFPNYLNVFAYKHLELRPKCVTRRADKDQKQTTVEARLGSALEDWVGPGTSTWVTAPKSPSVTYRGEAQNALELI